MYGNQVDAAESKLVASGPPSLSDRLANERKSLEERLDTVKKVQAAFKKNPEAQELLDAIARLGHFGY